MGVLTGRCVLAKSGAGGVKLLSGSGLGAGKKWEGSLVSTYPNKFLSEVIVLGEAPVLPNRTSADLLQNLLASIRHRALTESLVSTSLCPNKRFGGHIFAECISSHPVSGSSAADHVVTLPDSKDLWSDGRGSRPHHRPRNRPIQCRRS